MSNTVTAIGQRNIDPGSAAQRCWYVVSCKPRQELQAQENLRRQGFEVYLPRLKVRQRRRDRWVESVQVLFPRYLFVHVDRAAQSTASIRSTRGAVGLVRFGGEPATVPNRVIAAIIDREQAGFMMICSPRSSRAIRCGCWKARLPEWTEFLPARRGKSALCC